ncbi:MAG: acyl-CoA dehydrogenase, partial [Actinobacteria bacterium]|nr:acyl-CoA dehydrogenase [Actinomycetota bacterium]
MSIGISDEHVELASSLRKWAASLQGIDAVRAAEDDASASYDAIWAAVGEMGVATIALPEALGGGDGTVLDAVVALEACAHELLPGRLLGSVVAGALLARAGVPVPADAVVALSLGSGPVWDAAGATHLLAGSPDRWALVPIDAAVLRASRGLDLSRRFATLDSVDLDGPGAVAAPGLSAELVRRTAITFAAAEAAGVARWCLETAVEYAKVREQFGRKIGSFQAIKHLCAEMLETAEAVTAAAWDVAAAAGDESADEQWAFAADVALVTCFDGAVEVAKSCIQVLGGIGFTFEHDAHLYLRRALSLRGLLGDADEAALRLTDRAVAGVRRRLALDLEGRDDAIRPGLREQVAGVAALPEDQRRTALVETGLLMPHWPAPYGLGADAVQQIVIDEELAAAEVTRPDIVIAAWAVPTILEHGTDEQRERFVRDSLLGDIVWCQL